MIDKPDLASRKKSVQNRLYFLSRHNSLRLKVKLAAFLEAAQQHSGCADALNGLKMRALYRNICERDQTGSILEELALYTPDVKLARSCFVKSNIRSGSTYCLPHLHQERNISDRLCKHPLNGRQPARKKQVTVIRRHQRS